MEIIHSMCEYSITNQQMCKLYNIVEGLDVIDNANDYIHSLFLTKN